MTLFMTLTPVAIQCGNFHTETCSTPQSRNIRFALHQRTRESPLVLSVDTVLYSDCDVTIAMGISTNVHAFFSIERTRSTYKPRIRAAHGIPLCILPISSIPNSPKSYSANHTYTQCTKHIHLRSQTCAVFIIHGLSPSTDLFPPA